MHARACEAELAALLGELLIADQLPDLGALRLHFGPDATRLPQVHVQLGSLAAYEALVGSCEGIAA